MCSDQNGCNKEEWQNGNDKIESSLILPTTTKISTAPAPTTSKNDVVNTITGEGLLCINNITATCHLTEKSTERNGLKKLHKMV
jgi:hypothetical protein